MKVKKFGPIIIIYHGVPNSGKTTVLNLLIEVIKHESVVLYARRQGSKRGKDNRSVALMDDVLVGVGTGGDTHDAIIKNCKFFIAEECSICVTAAHKSSAILKQDAKVAKLLQQFGRIVDVSVNGAQCDVQQALMLFNRIKRFTSAKNTYKMYSEQNPYKISVW